MGENCLHNMTDNGLVYNIYKQFMQLHIKKKKIKSGQRPKDTFLQRRQ